MKQLKMYQLLNNFDVAYELLKYLNSPNDQLAMALLHSNCAEIVRQSSLQHGFDTYFFYKLHKEGYLNIFEQYLPHIKKIEICGNFVDFKYSYAINQLQGLTSLTLSNITIYTSDVLDICTSIKTLETLIIHHTTKYIKCNDAVLNVQHVHLRHLQIKYFGSFHSLLEKCYEIDTLLLFEVPKNMVSLLPKHHLLDKQKLHLEIMNKATYKYIDIYAQRNKSIEIHPINMEMCQKLNQALIDSKFRRLDEQHIRYIDITNHDNWYESVACYLGLFDRFNSVTTIRSKRLNFLNGQHWEYNLFKICPIISCINFQDCNIIDSLGDFWDSFKNFTNLEIIECSNTMFNRTHDIQKISLPSIKELYVNNSNILQYGVIFTNVHTIVVSGGNICTFLSELGSFQQLRNLRINKCSFTDCDNESIAKLLTLKLERLYVFECKNFQRFYAKVMKTFTFTLYKAHNFYP